MPLHSHTIPHVLPEEAGGDTFWFDRQNQFERQEIRRQVAFRRRLWPGLPDGAWSKRPNHTYPHILPAGCERLAFFPPLAGDILAYLGDEIGLHSEALNLKSSQVACLNILFPLRCNPSLATATFAQLIPQLAEVTELEFEYTGPENGGATQWLGEPVRGKRGQNRTSIDAALFWVDSDGRRRASLIEWKYTERSFGGCSAFAKAGRSEQRRCLEMEPAHPVAGRSCMLVDGGDLRGRRYWEHMTASTIVLDTFADMSGCPFAGPLYQLMRQQLLATHLVQAAIVERAGVLVISFGGNESLMSIPRGLASLGGTTIIEAWNRALDRANPVQHLVVENLLASVDATGCAEQGWRGYVRERYGV